MLKKVPRFSPLSIVRRKFTFELGSWKALFSSWSKVKVSSCMSTCLVRLVEKFLPFRVVSQCVIALLENSRKIKSPLDPSKNMTAKFHTRCQPKGSRMLKHFVSNYTSICADRHYLRINEFSDKYSTLCTLLSNPSNLLTRNPLRIIVTIK